MRGGQTDMILMGITMSLVAIVTVKMTTMWYTMAMKGR